MFYRRLLAGLLVVGAVVIAAPAVGQDKEKKKKKKAPPADAPVTLKWQFTTGEKGKFYQKMTTDTKQTMTVMGNPVTQTQKQTFYFEWTPVKQTGSRWEIEQKIVGVKMEIDIGGSKIAYDSEEQKAVNNPLADFFKALEKAKFTITLDTKTLEVTKIDGREQFVENLVKANQQMKPLLEQILSEEALKQMAAPTFAVIDTKEVKPKDSWDKTTKLDMGPIGTYTNKYKYTLEGRKNTADEDYSIKVDTELKYEAPKKDANPGGLPFRITSADLASKNATGTIVFDNKKGRVKSSELKLELNGKLSIEIGGTTTTVQLTQEQDSKVETQDEPFLKKRE